MKKQASLIRLGVSLAISWFSSTAMAGYVMEKPAPHGNPTGSEFGVSVAKHGQSSLVGSDTEHVRSPDEVPTGNGPYPSGYQGAVYLFQGNSSAPERVYQFPGMANHGLNIGAEVAMSQRFLAFTTGRGFRTELSDSVIIARRDRGAFPSCPTVLGQINCNAEVKVNGAGGAKALTRIPLTGLRSGGRYTLSLAISDDYLAIGYPSVTLEGKQQSMVEVYRYDQGADRFVREMQLVEPADRSTGAAIALDGQLLAIAAPHGGSAGPGTVRIFGRDAASQSWAARSYVLGHFTSGFGRNLAFRSGRLAVASAQHMTFYFVDAAGNLSSEQRLPTPIAHRFLALDGDVLAATNVFSESGGGGEVTLYRRSSSSGLWQKSSELSGFYYESKYLSFTSAYFAGDPIALSGDDLLLGWRAASSLKGAVIFERASTIDLCRDNRNRVKNCSFDTGRNTSLDAWPSGERWQLLSHLGAVGWADYSGGRLRVQMQNGGSEMWHVQARTTVDLRGLGPSVLSFRARADAPRTMVVNVGRDGSRDHQWTSYARYSATLGTEFQEYSFLVPSMPEDGAAFLDFNLGAQGTVPVTVDSVSLRPQD